MFLIYFLKQTGNLSQNLNPNPNQVAMLTLKFKCKWEE